MAPPQQLQDSISKLLAQIPTSISHLPQQNGSISFIQAHPQTYNQQSAIAQVARDDRPPQKSINPHLSQILQTAFLQLESVVQGTTDDEQQHYALPTIIYGSPLAANDIKRAYIAQSPSKKQVSFATEQFYINSNKQGVPLQTMALFKLETPASPPTTRTWINFNLSINRYQQSSQSVHPQSDSIKTTSMPIKIRTTTEVSKKQVFINSLMDLDQYKRVEFDQCEYFSFLDVYIGSCYLGTRFRLQGYQLSEFYFMQDEERESHRVACLNIQKKLTARDKCTTIAKLTNLDIKKFRIGLTELHSTYIYLRGKILSLIKMYQEKNYGDHRNPGLIAQIQHTLANEINIDTGLKSEEELQRYYETEDREQIYLQIYKEMMEFDHYLAYLWHKNIELIQEIPLALFTELVRHQLQKETTSKDHNMVISTKMQNRKSEHINFLKRRKEVLDDMKLYDDDDLYHPFVMHDNCRKMQVKEADSLVVFVHGYQGSNLDLEKAKNYLNIYNPRAFGLMIKSIQDQIDEGIEQLGEKVGEEIKAHISSTNRHYERISLLGYSLGGVIAREAIKHLEAYKDKMALMVTFASPHLGVSDPDNQLVKTGIWYLINFSKVKNLKELNCETETEESEFFLSRLSKGKELSWFKKLVLVSSQEDNFVPHHSARISQENKNQSIKTMAKNIIEHAQQIQRVQVWFDVEHNINTFDKILGRRAHIEFLENRIFLDTFFRIYGSQF